MTNPVCDISVIGLGPMGRNLALNLRDHGARVLAFDPFPEVRSRFATDRETAAMACANDWADMASRLADPQVILLMIKAGQPVDDALDALSPHLRPGAIVIDGGNSFWRETERREAHWASRGIRFVGAGVSGGEEGARRGPAIMAGGPQTAWPAAGRWLDAIAARSEMGPCCGWVGPGGAGHFVKMLHNGIEYAVMQTLGEMWLLLRDAFHLPAAEIAAQFQTWNEGMSGSFLLEISAEVLATQDDLGSGALIDVIRDAAGQKGTGNWASVAALELGVAAPALVEAVMARSLSGDAGGRRQVAQALGINRPALKGAMSMGDLARAFDAAVIAAYAQGFAVLEAAAETYQWPFDRARIATLWREGCILRAKLLNYVPSGWGNLLAVPEFAARIGVALPSWRRATAIALEAGVPVPVLAASLNWVEALATPRLWTALIQGQRDRFGAHGFARTDRDGTFHGPWSRSGE